MGESLFWGRVLFTGLLIVMSYYLSIANELLSLLGSFQEFFILSEEFCILSQQFFILFGEGMD